MLSRFFLIIVLCNWAILSVSRDFLHLDTYDADSLLEVLPGQTGEERVRTLNMLGISLFVTDTRKSEEFTNEARELSDKLNYPEGLAGTERNHGLISFYRGLFPQALDHYFNSLGIYRDLGLKSMEATLIYDIAALHHYAGNMGKTFEYLEFYRELVFDGTGKAGIRDSIRYYGGLAISYDILNEPDSCIKYYSLILQIAVRNNLKMVEIVSTTFVIGSFYIHKGLPDSAMVYFRKALSYPDVNPSVEALKYRSVKGMGWVYLSESDIGKAIANFHSAFQFYNERGFLYWALRASNDLGYLYLMKKDAISASKKFQVSERIFNEYLSCNSWYRNDSLSEVYAYGLEPYYPIPVRHVEKLMWFQGKRLYKNLFQINSSNGNTKEALRYHIELGKAQDTLNKILNKYETMELQIRYETKQKEDQLNLLARENELNESRLYLSHIIIFGMAGLILLIIFLAILLIRQNKLREKQNSLILQQKLFRSQMNPHFIFNSLSSIHNFMIYEKPAEAASYLSRFSKLIRTILNSSVEDYILLSEEIDSLENYLELQKARFTDRFDYRLQVDESLNPGDIYMPSMLTQPFVENAIEHGIRYKKTKGHIHVLFRKENGTMVFEVKDDGVGRAKAKELQLKEKKGRKSFGIHITRERILVLNRALKEKISLNVIDLFNKEGEAAGTKVVMKMPI